MLDVKLLHRRVRYQIHRCVKDLNYKDLGEQLNPTKNILAINSNFVHKAYDGFEEFINRPKKLTPSKKKLIATPGYKEQKKFGDDLQVFGVIDEKFHSGEIAVDGLSEFESVSVVSYNLSLLNYKFNVILPENTLIDISKMHDIISSDNFTSPFPIDYVSNPLDGIRKLSIKFNAS
ncbi:12654_t:CDS:2, partial [Entrophospora sp. SA101]